MGDRPVKFEKHGLWAKSLYTRCDKKTKRWVRRLTRALLEDLGEDLSSRERTLVFLTVPLILSVYRYGLLLLTDPNREPGQGRYLAAMNTIRRNLEVLGLKKREPQKVIDLETYLRTKLKEEEGEE